MRPFTRHLPRFRWQILLQKRIARLALRTSLIVTVLWQLFQSEDRGEQNKNGGRTEPKHQVTFSGVNLYRSSEFLIQNSIRRLYRACLTNGVEKIYRQIYVCTLLGRIWEKERSFKQKNRFACLRFFSKPKPVTVT